MAVGSSGGLRGNRGVGNQEKEPNAFVGRDCLGLGGMPSQHEQAGVPLVLLRSTFRTGKELPPGRSREDVRNHFF